MSQTERRWISVPEAAAIYSLHPKSVYQLCRKRLIPHTRIPSLHGGRGQVRIDRVEFDQMLEEREIQAAREPLDRRRKR